jgi:FMN phosphatase YigB (HAD superfamily)
MMMMETPIYPVVRPRAVLVTDLDNTLYDFPHFYEAGLRALLSAVQEWMDLDQEDALEALRLTYEVHDSIEYPFGVESIFRDSGLDRTTASQAAAACVAAFWASASDALRPYPSVRATLKLLRTEGIVVVGLTDAPVHEATRRLHHLGLLGCFSKLIALSLFDRRRPGSILVRLSDVPGYHRRRPRRVEALPKTMRKPNSDVYESLMAIYEVTPENMVVVGDSIERDLIPAMTVGARPLWARYGTRRFDSEKLIPKVVPFRLPEVTKKPTIPAAVAGIDRFNEVLQHLPVQQILSFRTDDERFDY